MDERLTDISCAAAHAKLKLVAHYSRTLCEALSCSCRMDSVLNIISDHT